MGRDWSGCSNSGVPTAVEGRAAATVGKDVGVRGGARAGGSDGGLAARCVVAIKARSTLASALGGECCYRLCLSARSSVSSGHLTQHDVRVEERGLAAGGLKACARVERSHGVVAVHVRWGAKQCTGGGETHISREAGSATQDLELALLFD